MRSHRMKKGFTLAELLIVVAIIAVLVAIAIPVFTKQLERSRESVDFANMRSAYTEVMVAAISDDAGSPLKKADGTFQAEITIKQKQEDWQTGGIENMRIGGVPYADWDSKMPAIDGTATVTFYPDSDKVIIDWSGSGSGSGSGIPSLHGAGRDITDEQFCRPGVVLQDQTGTYVLALSGTYGMWSKYTQGTSVAELAVQYPDSVKLVNASDIKDSSSIGTLQAGDLYYHSVDGTYYYVNSVNQYDDIPNGAWVPLIQ